MFKIELFFDESLGEVELKKLGARIDRIFAEETITKADKTLTSRTYYDNGTKLDYGYMMEALCVIKNVPFVLKNIKFAYWCNELKNTKDDIMTDLFYD